MSTYIAFSMYLYHYCQNSNNCITAIAVLEKCVLIGGIGNIKI